MNIIGIDPGTTGAIAFLSDIAVVEDMPVIPYGKTGYLKRAFDGQKLGLWLNNRVHQLSWDFGQMHAFVERVGPMPGQGVSSTFGLGMGYWGVVSVLRALNVPYTLVTPNVWKAHFGLGKEKIEALNVARKLFPNMAEHRLSRVKDHNRAEALLIALYGLHATERGASA